MRFFRKSVPGVLVLGLLIASLLSCSSTTNDAPPEPLVADSIMVEILIDLHLLEALQSLTQTVPLSTRDSILLQHNVTLQDYEQTILYYAANEEEYLTLYSAALNKLSDERYSTN